MTRAIVLLALLVAGLGCHRSKETVIPISAPPAGEVWLTAAQIKDSRITVATVGEENVDDTILTAGRVTFDDLRVSHVFSPVNGRVVRIDGQPGQRVKKGDPLAAIESPDIGEASSTLGKAQADLIAAEHEYRRQQALREAHATSDRDLEVSEDNYRKARAEMDRARQKAFLLRTGGVDRVSQTFTLLAGIDGEVIARNLSPGIEVQGLYSGGNAVELFTLGDLERVWVIAEVYEMDLGRVRVGSRATVKVVAYPKQPFVGKVEWVSGQLDATTRTAKVRGSFENKDKNHMLRPEMYATVEITVDERRALAIPRSALLRLGDATVVFLETGTSPDGRTKFERVPLTVDEGESSRWLPVLQGLEPGARVVTAGAVLLSGML